MTNWRQRLSRIVLLMAAWTIASVAGSAHAAAVAVTKYAVIQPIDVCATNGASGGCAPFNTSSSSPDPSTATSTTPIGWVNSSTNINLTREIWLRAGIDVTFLPMLQYNNSNYQSIDVNCSSNCTVLGSNALQALTTSPGPAAAGTCVSNCLVPIYLPSYAFPTANAIPMFFINSIVPSSALSGNTYYGFGWVNGAGVAVAKNTFFNGIGPVRYDTMSHELGHNLGLDHCTLGAGAKFNGVSPACPSTTSPVACGSQLPATNGIPNNGGCNVMNDGTVRILATHTDCTPQSTTSATSNGGELYDLNTGAYLSTALCASAPGTPPGSITMADALLATQTAQAVLSGFLNTQPNINAAAGGGSTVVTTSGVGATATATLCGTGNSILTFCVTNSSSNYIAALLISVPNTFNFTSPQYQQLSPIPPNDPTPSNVQVLHGNTGAGNNNCQKALPISSNASFQCLELDFPVFLDPMGSGNYISNFGPGETLVFETNIHTTSPGGAARLSQLECATTPTFPQECLDITEVFTNTYATTSFLDNTGNASSQLSLDPTIPPAFVDPAFFPTLAGLSPPPTFSGSPNPATGKFPPAPCTPNPNNGKCPKLAGGNPFGGD